MAVGAEIACLDLRRFFDLGRCLLLRGGLLLQALDLAGQVQKPGDLGCENQGDSQAQIINTLDK